MAVNVLRKHSVIFLTETAETKPENSISCSKLPRRCRKPGPCLSRSDVTPTPDVCKQIAHTSFHKCLSRRRRILPAAIVCCCVSLAMCGRWESQHIDLQTTPCLVCTNSYRLFSTAVIAQACSSHHISALAASC